MTRRKKILWAHPESIIAMLNFWKTGGTLRLPVIDRADLKDAEVTGVFFDAVRGMFAIVLWHEEWALVPEGEEMPHLGNPFDSVYATLNVPLDEENDGIRVLCSKCKEKELLAVQHHA